ncbi:MAG: SMC family ATPase, partial [Candidatus Altiarchaeota archaeon]|nr:SMC family ATPase [Candidatus Altiarchaeota archaeon]
MITKLKLNGWKSHLDSEIKLTKGTNVLVGIMGSGKSSVLQAISFALFGEIPEVRSREVKLDGLIMRKPKRLEQARVELEFTAGDIIYQVNRVLGRDASARLYREGSLLEHGSKRVSNKIAEILEIDYDNFNSVVYSRQNQLDQFLQLGKTDRVKLIDKILKIDLIEAARKNLLTIKRSVEGELIQLKQLANQETAHLKTELEKKTKERTVIEIELAQLKKQIKSEKLKLDKLREQMYQLERKSQEKQKIEREMSSFSGRLEQLQEKLKKLPKIDEPEKNLAETKKTIAETELVVEELSSQIIKLRTEKTQLEERLQDINKAEKLAVTEVADYSEKIQELRKELAGREAKQEEHKRAIAELKQADASCPVCGSELKDRQAHIERHSKDLAELDTKIEKTRAKLAKLEIEQKQNERLMRDVSIAKKLI